LSELHALANGARYHALNVATLLETHAFTFATDPRLAPPKLEGEVPDLDFAPLDDAVERLQRTARRYDDDVTRLAAAGFPSVEARHAELNALLGTLEQALTDPRGLPGRPWFKHMIYAPGINTGYAAKTVPAVREAIEDGRWADADEYLAITAQALVRYCDRVDQAIELLR
jgi:N-acetylated-alpha-linked acidic dipeptidase